jgi:hypothetical protein
MRLRLVACLTAIVFERGPLGIVVGIGEVFRRDFDALWHRGDGSKFEFFAGGGSEADDFA